ncbi:hypothetical protein SJAV_14880 [Sulfurisphaera javensis]|uniref:Uncharacterized protein n=1 Tax=Sulfurisphaera javensis TaxID=2049879 RepID=A0AAT9GS73_9CREN
MKVKFSSIEIKGDLLPHTKDDVNQYKEIASFILDAIGETPITEITIDDKLLYFSSFLTTKLIEGILDNVYAYTSEIKGPKYLSGDVSMIISEAITYATLNALYDVKLTNIIPFRSVKYLGTIVDAMIDLNYEEKLSKFIGSKGGVLFVNIRSSMNPRSYYLIDKLAKSLINLEIVRYPDNYGLISMVIKDKNLKEIFIFIKP